MLVTVSVAVAVILTWALTRHGIGLRYTLPAGVIGSLLVTQALARGMTSPLREMTAAARAMATGDYTRRVRATSHDEVGELAQAFNTMAADLATVDRERKELVANVSHELRTPVAALRATLENLVDGVDVADPQTLSVALAQTERLGDLVTQLLDLSRLEAGVVPLDRVDLPLQAFLQEAVEASRLVSAAVHRVVGWEVDVTPPTLSVPADPARLHQVVANLLDNAARHSPTGGLVRVTAQPVAHAGGSAVLIEVRDEGPGITADQRDRVFERFHRADSAQSGTGGTGLGLAIARWAVTLHGGTISVADSPDGCRMQVVLPGQTSVPVA